MNNLINDRTDIDGIFESNFELKLSEQTDSLANQLERILIVNALERNAYIIKDVAKDLEIDERLLLKKMIQYQMRGKL